VLRKTERVQKEIRARAQERIELIPETEEREIQKLWPVRCVWKAKRHSKQAL
jgi:hypothetical protein